MVLYLDANNRRSHIDAAGSQRSLINTDTWTVGTGSVTGYPMNGATAENQRLYDADPFGMQSIVWGTYPDGTSNGPDGGWDGTSFAINNTKTYRFSVWVRRTSTTTGGSFYLGLHTNGTGDVFHLSDGLSQTNPYWTYTNIGTFVQNTWYLVVGHIYPATYTGTTPHPDSGIYTIAGGLTKFSNNLGNVPNDVKFPSNATTAMQRVYHYYANTDATARLQFAFPRVDIIDGYQPSIKELLSKSYSGWYDMIGAGTTGTLTNGAVFNYSTKSIDFDGTNDYVDCGNPTSLQLSSQITMAAWVYPVSVTLNGNIMSKNANAGYRFRIGSSNELWWYVSGNALVSSNGVCPLNTWSYCVVTGDVSGLKMYLNGVLLTSNTTAFAPTAPASGNFYIGCYGIGSEVFNGKIANAQVYNRALTAAEVNTNFQASRDRYGI